MIHRRPRSDDDNYFGVRDIGNRIGNRAGTDPRSAASKFRISALQKSANDVQISFPTVVGKEYLAKRKDELSAVWADFGDPVVGTGGAVEIVDVGGAARSQRFYCIEVRPAN